MELIKLFLGVLLVACLILSIDYNKINDYFRAKKIAEEYALADKILGIEIKDFKGRVKIIEVPDYSPARLAGLEVGDRILELNGEKVTNSINFIKDIEKSHDTKYIKLLVHRVDSRSTFPVEIKPVKVSYQP